VCVSQVILNGELIVIVRSAAKANSVIGQLKHAFTTWSISSLKILYTSFIRPHLEYASSVWNPLLKSDEKIIENVQRRAIRLVKSLREFDYEKKLSIFGLTTLKRRRIRGDLISFFKI